MTACWLIHVAWPVSEGCVREPTSSDVRSIFGQPPNDKSHFKSSFIAHLLSAPDES